MPSTISTAGSGCAHAIPASPSARSRIRTLKSIAKLCHYSAMQRRTFLLTAAAQVSMRGANDRIRTGIIGAGGRGRYLTAQFKEIGAEMAAVCDVYDPNLQ